MKELNALKDAVISGKAPEVEKLVKEAIDEGVPVSDILNEGLIKGIMVAGKKFSNSSNSEFSIPELFIADRAMKAGMVLIRLKEAKLRGQTFLAEEKIEPIGKVVIGTLLGEPYDLGKSIVSMMLENAGFEVIDLGVNVPPERFIDVIKEKNVQIAALSCRTSVTMESLKKTIDAIEEAGLRDSVKIMVGGLCITQQYAESIGADGYAPDAVTAVEKAKEMLEA